MFSKKLKCPNCGRGVEKSWKFCPYCGYPLKRRNPFEEIEDLVDKELEKFDRMFGFKLPRIKIVPSRGISITISSSPMRVETAKTRKPEKVKEIPIEEENPPKVTEEPKTNIKRLGYRDVVEIELPEVKSLKDIQIRGLEQSIEVKARVGDKLYFKLLPIPPGRAMKKKFSNGKLTLIIER